MVDEIKVTQCRNFIVKVFEINDLNVDEIKLLKDQLDELIAKMIVIVGDKQNG